MIFKSRKGPLAGGIILITIAVLIGLVLALVLFEDGADVSIVVALIFLFIAFPLAGFGMWIIYNYKKSKAGILAAREKYGEAQIIASIERATAKIYRVPRSGRIVYFTNKFIVAAGEAILGYDEVQAIYKYVASSRHMYIPFLAVELVNGKTRYLCDYIKDEEINEILQICKERNPQILCSFQKPPTTEEKEKETAKRVVGIGVAFCLFSIAIFFLLLLDIGNAGYDKILAPVAALLNAAIGLLLIAFGGSKLKGRKEAN